MTRVQAPKVDGRDPVILTGDEYERLLAACVQRPMLAMFVLLLGETGARCESEALKLRWEDVDLDAGFLWIAESQRRPHEKRKGTLGAADAATSGRAAGALRPVSLRRLAVAVSSRDYPAAPQGGWADRDDARRIREATRAYSEVCTEHKDIIYAVVPPPEGR